MPEDCSILKLDISNRPKDWDEHTYSPETSQWGSRLLKRAEFAIIQIPSAILPDEFNFLINPLHSQFRNFSPGNAQPFVFNSRF